MRVIAPIVKSNFTAGIDTNNRRLIRITRKNLPTLPGSLLTNARIMKYKVAAPKTKNTKNLIIPTSYLA